MLCKCHWIVLYTVHFTAFCLGGPFLSGHGVVVPVKLFNATRCPFTTATVVYHSECVTL